MARQMKYSLIEILFLIIVWSLVLVLDIFVLFLLMTTREDLFMFIRVKTILDLLLLSVSKSQQIVSGMVLSNTL